ncbi:sigma-70 factor domain-containing protein [Vulcanococcus limneticus]|uniref:sigma-70 factor domain-containing protein n=1 Tax=Vulcanococcus limneticus TaxID=2170428 RepID=UPI000B988B4F|nr:sigma-70 factor domain-containing protein [Vulcanococcus limneticus]
MGGCDALSQHIRSISRLALLSAEAEISLARLVQSGCRATGVAQEMTLRAGGVAPSLAAWAREAGMLVRRLQRYLRGANHPRSRMVLANFAWW